MNLPIAINVNRMAVDKMITKSSSSAPPKFNFSSTTQPTTAKDEQHQISHNVTAERTTISTIYRIPDKVNILIN